MLRDVLDRLGSLTLEEKRAIEEAAREAVARELGARSASAPDACPRCGRPLVRQEGPRPRRLAALAMQGVRADVPRQDGVAAGVLQAGAQVWPDYVGDMLSGSSLRDCARLCGVTLKTSWFMRMRLCEVMARAAQPFRTGEAVSWQVDGTYLDESLKGNRSRSALKMPRDPHRHGGAVHERGISSLKACVVRGTNDPGDSFCRLAGRGRPADAELAASLGGLGPCERVATDGRSGYARVLPGLGAADHEAKAAGEAPGELGMVNALHQRLKHFLARFAEASTRWLGHYLAWFQWAEQARRSGSRPVRVLSGQASAGRYEHTRAALLVMPQPLWGYWEQKGAMSAVV